MSDQTIQELLVRVGQEVGFIEKALVNGDSRYNARGIDDVLAAFHQPLLDAGVVVRPQHRFIEGHWGESTRDGRTSVTRTVTLESTFTFVGPNGDELSITAIGEASDTSDKAANQAMQAAMKYAFLQAFVVPTGEVDADSKTHVHGSGQSRPAPQATGAPTVAGAVAARAENLGSRGKPSGAPTEGQLKNLKRLQYFTDAKFPDDQFPLVSFEATGIEYPDRDALNFDDASKMITFLKERAGEEVVPYTPQPQSAPTEQAPPPDDATFEGFDFSEEPF